MEEIYKYILVFFASLLGSLHCVSMCGGFSCLVAASCSAKKNVFTSSIFSILIYHFGRLVTYCFMSYLFFTFGEYLKYVSGYYWASGIILLVMIIVFMLSFFNEVSVSATVPSTTASMIGKFNLLSYTKILFASVLKRASIQTSAMNSLSIGLLSTTIPCGWLYLNIALAGAEPKIERVFIHIFSFWLGTIPLLTATALFARGLLSKFSIRNKLVGYTIVSMLSFYSVYLHFSGGTHEHGANNLDTDSQVVSCH